MKGGEGRMESYFFLLSWLLLREEGNVGWEKMKRVEVISACRSFARWPLSFFFLLRRHRTHDGPQRMTLITQGT